MCSPGADNPHLNDGICVPHMVCSSGAICASAGALCARISQLKMPLYVKLEELNSCEIPTFKGW